MFSPAHRLLKVCGGGELLGYGLAHGKAILGTWWFFGGVWWWKFHSFTIWLWLTWLENPSHGGFSGKIIHKWAMASMAMLNNQRVNWVHNQFIINVKNKDWRLSYPLIIRYYEISFFEGTNKWRLCFFIFSSMVTTWGMDMARTWIIDEFSGSVVFFRSNLPAALYLSPGFLNIADPPRMISKHGDTLWVCQNSYWKWP